MTAWDGGLSYHQNSFNYFQLGFNSFQPLQEPQCILGFVSASVSPFLETDSVFLAQKCNTPAADSNEGLM